MLDPREIGVVGIEHDILLHPRHHRGHQQHGGAAGAARQAAPQACASASSAAAQPGAMAGSKASKATPGGTRMRITCWFGGRRPAPCASFSSMAVE